MKKLLLLFTIIALFASCKKEENITVVTPNNDNNDSSYYQIKINISNGNETAHVYFKHIDDVNNAIDSCETCSGRLFVYWLPAGRNRIHFKYKGFCDSITVLKPNSLETYEKIAPVSCDWLEFDKTF